MNKKSQKKFKIAMMETVQDYVQNSVLLRGHFYIDGKHLSPPQPTRALITGSWTHSFDKNLSVVGFIKELRDLASWLEDWWNKYGGFHEENTKMGMCSKVEKKN